MKKKLKSFGSIKARLNLIGFLPEKDETKYGTPIVHKSFSEHSFLL